MASDASAGPFVVDWGVRCSPYPRWRQRHSGRPLEHANRTLFTYDVESMSEHLTHMGAFEDVVRLVLHSGVLNATLERSLTSYYDTALLATSSRGNHYYGVPLLEEVRDRRSARGDVHEKDQQLLAAALGWLTHRAVDHKLDDDMVPKLEQLRQEEGLSEEEANIDEHQIYEDAIVFREV